MQDAMIIEMYFERKESAITATAAKYGMKLECVAGHFVSPQDAQECVNDTYMEAWNHIPPKRPQYFFAWLAKICRHKALGKIEWENAGKRKAEVVALTEEMAECVPDRSKERAEIAEEIGAVLSAFLKALPEVKRYYFIRRYWYGDSIADIAALTGDGASRIKTSLHRTRNDLKQYLEKEGVTL